MVESSNRKFKTICVFGGTNFGKGKEYLKAAVELGKTLAARKINLVYGGGSLGLRGSVAVTATVAGSSVLGIMLKPLAAKRDIIGMTIGNEFQVMSMHGKMTHMILNADAFVALPGGFETLEEIFNIASWTHFNIHKKPLGLLNVNGFFDGLLFFLDYAVEQGFMTQANRRILVSASNVDELIDQLQNFVPEVDSLMSQLVWDSEESSNKKRALDLNLRL